MDSKARLNWLIRSAAQKSVLKVYLSFLTTRKSIAFCGFAPSQLRGPHFVPPFFGSKTSNYGPRGQEIKPPFQFLAPSICRNSLTPFTQSVGRFPERAFASSSIAGSESEDTIVAVVTATNSAAGPGGVSIVRLSGSSAISMVSQMFLPGKRKEYSQIDNAGKSWKPESHKVEYGWISDPNDSRLPLDEVLVLPMIAPRSYTAEDVVEIHCHGGHVCCSRILQACIAAGGRLAQPGEFTLRAFLNGRLDLSAAENIPDLISAQTIEAADSALSGLQGGLSSIVRQIRAECIDILVEVEARLDFDEDLPALDSDDLIRRIGLMSNEIDSALSTAKRKRLMTYGMQIAIVGRPNVGKSSLLNAWSRSERAIVTNIPGTTRDIVEADIAISGIPVKLLDTAGMRDTEDTVEKIGVERSETAARGADVIVMVVSASDGWTDEDSHIFHRIWGSEADSSNGTLQRALAGPMSTAQTEQSSQAAPVTSAPILVMNKVDTVQDASVWLPDLVRHRFGSNVVHTSAVTGQGLEDLDAALLQLVGAGEVQTEGRKWAVNQRQSEQLIRAKEALSRVRDTVQQGLPVDFWTIDIREASLALGQITGEDVSEEVLEQIFSRFCIGK